MSVFILRFMVCVLRDNFSQFCIKLVITAFEKQSTKRERAKETYRHKNNITIAGIDYFIIDCLLPNDRNYYIPIQCQILQNDSLSSQVSMKFYARTSIYTSMHAQLENGVGRKHRNKKDVVLQQKYSVIAW